MSPPGDSPRRVIPWGLVVTIATVAAIEWGAIGDNINFLNSVAASWQYSSRVVAGKAPGKAVLCFGDSMVKFGLLPRVIAGQTGEKVYNLALSGGSAPSSYFLLRRVLRANARPSVIVVDFACYILGSDPTSVDDARPWADLLTFREAAELSLAARAPDLLASFVLKRALPTEKGRYEIRSHILAALKGERSLRGEFVSALWRNWNVNAGGQANQKWNPFPDVVIPASMAAARRGKWRCDPVNAVFVRRFLDLASRHGITVVWLLPPLSPGTQSVYEYTGDELGYLEFVREALARSPGLVVLDGRHANFQSRVFIDGVHLDRDGAAALSVAVGKSLNGRRTGTAPGQRWVKLPDYSDPPAQLAVEDLVQSLVAVKERSARRRR